MKYIKPKQCKGCPSFHTAGRKDDPAYNLAKYNAWCCRYGKPAIKAMNHCRMSLSGGGK